MEKSRFFMKGQTFNGRFKWNDIRFETHSVVPNSVQAVVDFPNGEYCSIVGGGKGLYGDGVDTFEICSSVTERTSRCVRGWLDKKQVMAHLKYLQNK